MRFWPKGNGALNLYGDRRRKRSHSQLRLTHERGADQCEKTGQMEKNWAGRRASEGFEATIVRRQTSGERPVNPTCRI